MIEPISSVSAITSNLGVSGIQDEFSIPPLDGAGPAAAPAGGSFGSQLADAMQSLVDSQNEATKAASDLATGQASDITAVAMSIERASLSLQLATQVRNKTVEAYQDLFRMQV